MTDPKRILLIDDDPSVTTYLERLLQVLGHRVDTVANGADGLKKAAKPGYDLVISDLYLPGDPSGIDLIKQLRAASPSLPVVVISGFPTQDRLDLCRELGVREFLTKPFELSLIKTVLGQLFGSDGSATPPAGGQA